MMRFPQILLDELQNLKKKKNSNNLTRPKKNKNNITADILMLKHLSQGKEYIY